MTSHLVPPAPQAYAYPLLVKQLLLDALSLHGDQQITYRGERRHAIATSANASAG
ncbi:hypothetical protein J2T05_004715 [Cupriavidus necator]|nr:hypothetical protein [Cupriavidus necator]